MKRMIKASHDSNDDGIQYRLYNYDVENEEEENCVKVFDDEDEAIRYCSDYAVDAHVVKVYPDWYTEVIYENF